MKKNDLITRTHQFSVNIIHLVNQFDSSTGAYVIGKQIIRSATSVAANYRAACRAKSKADFIYKLKIVEEEADESFYWLQLSDDVNIVNDKNLIRSLKNEADELIAIFTKSLITLKKQNQLQKSDK